MHKGDKKFFCDVCEYGTNINYSFKKHLQTIKHFRNSRESSVTIDIKKHTKSEKINIEICGEPLSNDAGKSDNLLENMINELSHLRQENALLKMSALTTSNNSKSSVCNFTSIFDDDFSCLFQ